MEQEEIYIVSQKARGGDWHKWVKSQDRWWYSENEAIEWLKTQPDWLQVSNAVFKILITVDRVEKIFDGKILNPEFYEACLKKS